ncbi:putative proline utilization protein PrnX [Aspergillus ruber CBS 135680]|uniref:NAD(P)-binding protein n=1 Tax=Aspergillus ruber (strain CBS 135680) TaxID=1388766 RepID=A0A017SDI9_ASPRC|nr:NAD(P)-binding protein [Aspergillus ruber CBS 135680]EYE95038.1 NAD(P)-binding protein [Aspergillus ruber CBS 135680]
MHLLTESNIATILTSLTPTQGQEFLNILTQSLSSNTNNAIHQPARTSIVTDQSTALFMPVSNTTTTGIKIVHVPRACPIAGVINLFDPENGHLQGVLGAAEITAFRTALATMTLFVQATGEQTGIKRENIVVFGSGRQAEWHARLALLLSPPGSVQSITFVNRGRARLQALEKEVFPVLRGEYPGVTMNTLSQETLSQDVYEARLQGLLGGSDVIFSCTPATKPNFPFAYLQQHPKRRFLGLIGSYKPQMQEIDTETLLSGGGGKIYVDSKEACLEESGELIRAGVTEDQLVEIGEVYGGSSAVQIETNSNVVFKCVGMGLMDLVIAKQVLEVAIRQGQGMNVEGFA